MTAYIALLRAVNVGGTGKLPMEDLRALCAEAGFRQGANLYRQRQRRLQLAESPRAQVKAALGGSSCRIMPARRVGVFVRTAAEMAAVAANNPFAELGRQPDLSPSFSTHRRPVTRSIMWPGRKDERIALGIARDLCPLRRGHGQVQARGSPAAKARNGAEHEHRRQARRIGGAALSRSSPSRPVRCGHFWLEIRP